jgi:hypothetical protein
MIAEKKKAGTEAVPATVKSAYSLYGKLSGFAWMMPCHFAAM